MRLKTAVVALLLMVAAGPALAMGGVGAQPTSIDTTADDCAYPITVEDTTGTEITIDEEPEEIVILAPNVAQHVWELGAEEKVTGMPVNQFTAYLEGSEQRTNVVDELGQPINEDVVGLEADLVLAPNIISQESVDELRESEQTVYQYAAVADLDEMLASVEQTGQLVGECETATELTDDLSDRIDAVEESVDTEQRLTVFYDLGDEPSGPFTVNDGALEHDVVTTAGGENIAADIQAGFGGGYPEISTETILEADPEVVIAPDGRLSEFPGYDETAAFENDRVIEVDGNLISQHGPRNVDILEEIADDLREFEGDAGEETDDADATDDADDSGPGLTVGAAVAALVGVALVVLRRE